MTTMLKQSEEVVFNAFEQAIAGAASVDVSLVTVIGMTEDGVPLTFTGRRLSDTVKEIEVESMMGMGNEAAIAAWNSATRNRTEFFTSVLSLAEEELQSTAGLEVDLAFGAPAAPPRPAGVP